MLMRRTPMLVIVFRGGRRMRAFVGVGPLQDPSQLVALNGAWSVGRHRWRAPGGPERLAQCGSDLVRVMAAERVAVHAEVSQCFGARLASPASMAFRAVALEDRACPFVGRKLLLGRILCVDLRVCGLRRRVGIGRMSVGRWTLGSGRGGAGGKANSDTGERANKQTMFHG